NLISALPVAVAIVRTNQFEIYSALERLDLQVIACDEAGQEMADSLSAAIRYANALEPTTGFVVALADMPYILPQTIAQVVRRLQAGAGLVIPAYGGIRGHPVGFSIRFSEELQRLTGDQGARSLLARYPDE